MDLKKHIRVINDFPKENISFKDITTILENGEVFKYTIDVIAEYLKDKKIDKIVGPEARGFLFGVPLAYKLGVGFVPVRKPGKLPYDTVSIQYDLEYGKDELQMHKDAIKPGEKVVIVDDLLATGGTISSVAKLVEKLGGEVVNMSFVVELTDLKGKDKLQKYDVMSLVKYDI